MCSDFLCLRDCEFVGLRVLLVCLGVLRVLVCVFMCSVFVCLRACGFVGLSACSFLPVCLSCLWVVAFCVCACVWVHVFVCLRVSQLVDLWFCPCLYEQMRSLCIYLHTTLTYT